LDYAVIRDDLTGTAVAASPRRTYDTYFWLARGGVSSQGAARFDYSVPLGLKEFQLAQEKGPDLFET
jgi:hypothetical protein